MTTTTNFSQEYGMTAMLLTVDDTYAAWSVCDPRWLLPYACIGMPFLYIVALLWWVRWNRRKPLRIHANRSDEIANRYSTALSIHVRRAHLYLQFLDLIVIADPLVRNERQRIRDLLKSQLDRPAHGLPSLKKLRSLERLADSCWEKHVLEAGQLIPAGPAVSQSADGAATISIRESLNGTMISSACVRLDWRTDLADIWPSICDLLQACGVNFTRQEIVSLSGDEDGVMDPSPHGFLSLLMRRMYAAGCTIVSTNEGDGVDLLFLRASDILALELVLRALFSANRASVDHDRAQPRHNYGKYRLFMPNELHRFPQQHDPVDDGRVLPQAGTSCFKLVWYRVMGSCWGSFCLFFVVLTILSCLCGGVVLSTAAARRRWGTVDWAFSALHDCIWMPITLMFVISCGLLVLHVILVNMVCRNYRRDSKL